MEVTLDTPKVTMQEVAAAAANVQATMPETPAAAPLLSGSNVTVTQASAGYVDLDKVVAKFRTEQAEQRSKSERLKLRALAGAISMFSTALTEQQKTAFGKIDADNKKIDENTAKIDSLTTTNKSLEKDLKDAQSEVEKAQSAVDAYQTLYDTCVKEGKTDEAAKALALLTTAKASLATRQKKVDEINGKISANKSQIAKLEGDNKKLDDDISSQMVLVGGDTLRAMMSALQLDESRKGASLDDLDEKTHEAEKRKKLNGVDERGVFDAVRERLEKSQADFDLARSRGETPMV